MKRYIKSSDSSLNNLPILEHITIHLDANIDKYIESADLIGEGLLEDSQVLADWNCFIQNTYNAIAKHTNLKLLHEAKGKPLKSDPNIPGSYYFYLGVTDDNGKLKGKIVICLRLSTHQSTKTSASAGRKHNDNTLQIIRKIYPDVSDIINKELVVNKKTFNDYDDATLAIIGMINKIASKYGE